MGSACSTADYRGGVPIAGYRPVSNYNSRPSRSPYDTFLEDYPETQIQYKTQPKAHAYQNQKVQPLMYNYYEDPMVSQRKKMIYQQLMAKPQHAQIQEPTQARDVSPMPVLRPPMNKIMYGRVRESVAKERVHRPSSVTTPAVRYQAAPAYAATKILTEQRKGIRPIVGRMTQTSGAVQDRGRNITNTKMIRSGVSGRVTEHFGQPLRARAVCHDFVMIKPTDAIRVQDAPAFSFDKKGSAFQRVETRKAPIESRSQRLQKVAPLPPTSQKMALAKTRPVSKADCTASRQTPYIVQTPTEQELSIEEISESQYALHAPISKKAITPPTSSSSSSAMRSKPKQQGWVGQKTPTVSTNDAGNKLSARSKQYGPHEAVQVDRDEGVTRARGDGSIYTDRATSARLSDKTPFSMSSEVVNIGKDTGVVYDSLSRKKAHMSTDTDSNVSLVPTEQYHVSEKRMAHKVAEQFGGVLQSVVGTLATGPQSALVRTEYDKPVPILHSQAALVTDYAAFEKLGGCSYANEQIEGLSEAAIGLGNIHRQSALSIQPNQQQNAITFTDRQILVGASQKSAANRSRSKSPATAASAQASAKARSPSPAARQTTQLPAFRVGTTGRLRQAEEQLAGVSHVAVRMTEVQRQSAVRFIPDPRRTAISVKEPVLVYSGGIPSKRTRSPSPSVQQKSPAMKQRTPNKMKAGPLKTSYQATTSMAATSVPPVAEWAALVTQTNTQRSPVAVRDRSDEVKLCSPRTNEVVFGSPKAYAAVESSRVKPTNHQKSPMKTTQMSMGNEDDSVANIEAVPTEAVISYKSGSNKMKPGEYPWERVSSFSKSTGQEAALVSSDCQEQAVYEKLTDQETKKAIEKEDKQRKKAKVFDPLKVSTLQTRRFFCASFGRLTYAEPLKEIIQQPAHPILSTVKGHTAVILKQNVRPNEQGDRRPVQSSKIDRTASVLVDGVIKKASLEFTS